MSDLIPWMAPWSGRALVAAVFAVGLAVAVWGLRRRPLMLPHCRRCRYNLTGLPTCRCPECGWVPRSERSALLGTQRWWLVAAGLLIALALPAYVVAKRTKQYGWEYYLTFGPGHYFFGKQTIDEVVVGGARVRIVRDRSPAVWAASVQITHRGRPVGITVDCCWPSLGSEVRGKPRVGLGEDITGDGLPNVIIQSDSGGNGACCVDWTILSIREDGIDVLVQFGASRGTWFEDVTGDGALEFFATDRLFGYYWTSGANSPYPYVPHRLVDGRYIPDPSLMRKPAPAWDALDIQRESFRNLHGTWDEADPRDRFAALLEIALDLIYTGNALLAWEYLKANWSDEFHRPLEEFTSELLSLLHRSIAWNAILAMHDNDESLGLAAFQQRTHISTND